MEYDKLTALVIDALEDIKGTDIRVLNVRDKTTITDMMVVVTGNSNRQVKALVDSVVTRCKAQGFDPIGVEGADIAEWALIDLDDVVVHVMQPSVRDFYNIEKLWGEDSPGAQIDQNG